MKTARIILAMMFMAFAFVATNSFAANNTMEKQGVGQVSKGDVKVLHDVTRASKITGSSVVDPKGENLGKIDDLVISKDGRIQYAVLAHGGVLGAGEKLYAIPWKAVKPGDKEDTYIISIDKERLAKAPSFEKGNWPNFADRDVYMMYYGYYGVQPDMGTAESSTSQSSTSPHSMGTQGSNQGMTSGSSSSSSTQMNK